MINIKETTMRACATLALAMTAGLYVIAGAALSQPADVTVPPIPDASVVLQQVTPTGLDDFAKLALGAAGMVITVAVGWITTLIPAFARKWKAKMDAETAALEAARAASEAAARKSRVELVDKVMAASLSAGATPDAAAALTAQKIPDTVAASNKTEADLAREVVTLPEPPPSADLAKPAPRKTQPRKRPGA